MIFSQRCYPSVYEDEWFFVIDKPPGHFVHPPEVSKYPVDRRQICLYNLQTALNRPVYPVHRLDAPTSGLLVFAYDKGATRTLSALFSERKIKKVYHAVVRGFLPTEGVIDLPLEIKGFMQPSAAETRYFTKAHLELPVKVGKKYPTARYSFVEAMPLTGRWHQIRRHFDRVAHPILGDIEHGDSHHNRFFRDELKIPGLCLRAVSLEFMHPFTGEPLKLKAPSHPVWQRIFDLFGSSTAGSGLDRPLGG